MTNATETTGLVIEAGGIRAEGVNPKLTKKEQRTIASAFEEAGAVIAQVRPVSVEYKTRSEEVKAMREQLKEWESGPAARLTLDVGNAEGYEWKGGPQTPALKALTAAFVESGLSNERIRKARSRLQNPDADQPKGKPKDKDENASEQTLRNVSDLPVGEQIGIGQTVLLSVLKVVADGAVLTDDENAAVRNIGQLSVDITKLSERNAAGAESGGDAEEPTAEELAEIEKAS